MIYDDPPSCLLKYYNSNYKEKKVNLLDKKKNHFTRYYAIVEIFSLSVSFIYLLSIIIFSTFMRTASLNNTVKHNIRL